MTTISVERHPLGPRVRVARQRVHHGAVGALVAIAAVHRRDPLAGLLAAALMTLRPQGREFVVSRRLAGLSGPGRLAYARRRGPFTQHKEER